MWFYLSRERMWYCPDTSHSFMKGSSCVFESSSPTSGSPLSEDCSSQSRNYVKFPYLVILNDCINGVETKVLMNGTEEAWFYHQCFTRTNIIFGFVQISSHQLHKYPFESNLSCKYHTFVQSLVFWLVFYGRLSCLVSLLFIVLCCVSIELLLLFIVVIKCHSWS